MQAANPELINPEELPQWGWDDVSAFDLLLNDERISFQRPIRFVPHQRMVCFSATKADAVYKLIYGRNAHKKQQRELEKLNDLYKLGIKAPKLFDSGVVGPLAWFAMEKIVEAKPLSAYQLDDKFPDLSIQVLVSLYEKNVIHNDPHLDNFLVLNDSSDIKILDAAAIEVGCTKRSIEKNLALFLIQIDGRDDAAFKNILNLISEKFHLNKKRVQKYILKSKSNQISKFIKKVCRESTALKKIEHESYSGLIKRSVSDEEFAKIDSTLMGCPSLLDGQSSFVDNGYLIHVFQGATGRLDLNMDSGVKAINAWKYASAINKFVGLAPEPVAFLHHKNGKYFIVSACPFGDLEDDSSGLRYVNKTKEDMALILRSLRFLHRFNFYYGGRDFESFVIRKNSAVITNISQVGWKANKFASILRARRDVSKFNHWRLED